MPIFSYCKEEKEEHSRMASTSLLLAFIACIVSLTSSSGTAYAGNLQCEDIPVDFCAFAVSSSGSRCVLEKTIEEDTVPQFECQTSVVMAEKVVDWIESDECIRVCGLERMTVGLSTDYLTEMNNYAKLCSKTCRNGCPNIFDLYTKLAEGEGVLLPKLCEAQMSNSRALWEHISFASLSLDIASTQGYALPPSPH